MRAPDLALCIALAALLAAPPAAAQVPGVTTPEETLVLTAALDQAMVLVSRGPNPALGDVAQLHYRYSDESIENVKSDINFVDQHNFEYPPQFRWLVNPDAGNWNVQFFTPSRQSIRAGEKGEGDIQVVHSPSTTAAFVEGEVTLTLRSGHQGTASGANATIEPATVVLKFVIRIAPTPYATLRVLDTSSPSVPPDEDHYFAVEITNLDLYPDTFSVRAQLQESVGITPGDVAIVGQGDFFVTPGETRTVTMGFHAPQELFWYRGIQGIILLSVEPSRGGAKETKVYTFYVDGFVVDENLALLITVFLAQLALLFFLLAYAKRAYDRRYLGRPIPPWEIPEERAHLARLAREDPRAHYVTRYFLMVEEYRSALLWFYTYKKVSKRQLKAELRALELKERADELAAQPRERFDRASARLQRRYERRIERRKAWIQRRIDRLQRKLDRTYERDYDKDHEAWERKVERVQKKHNRPYLKAHKKWENEVEKALAAWEKPFKRDKAKHEKAMAKAREAYVARVKKVDKPAWKAWRDVHEDWEQEAKLSRREGHEPPPEPLPESAASGPPELPAPFQEPSKPDLPPEPKPVADVPLPPEPQLAAPALATSHYAKKARRAERKGWRKIRALEIELATRLDDLDRRRGRSAAKVARKREEMLAASEAVASTGWVSRVLGRSPERLERRQHLDLIRGRTRQRERELRERESLAVERVALEGRRAEADLEARIIRERSAMASAGRSGRAAAADGRARLSSLEQELAALKAKNRERLREESQASKERIQAGVDALKAQEREAVEREASRAGAAAPPPAPAQP